MVTHLMCDMLKLLQDFLEVLLHHAVTLALLLICYAINMVKMGVLIVLVHDVSDVPLEVWVNAGRDRVQHC